MPKRRRVDFDAMTENRIKSMLFSTDDLPASPRTKRLKKSLASMLEDYRMGYF